MKRRGEAYRQVAEAQANAGDIPGSRQTLRLVREGEDTSDVVAAIAEAQARAGDIKGATATALSIARDQYYRDAALQSIASLQANRGDLAGAIATSDYDRAFAWTGIAEALSVPRSGHAVQK